MYALTAAIAAIGSNSLLLSPIAPEVAESFGTSVRAVMSASAAYGLGTAGGALLLARHIDRLGARRTLALSLLVLAIALAASALSGTATALVAAQALAGIAAGVALPSIYAETAQVAPQGRESATLGFVLTGWTLSLVAGVSLSAVIADLAHWRWIYAGLSALTAVLALAIARRNGAPASPGSHPGSQSPSPWHALALPGVARLLLLCAAYMLSFYATYAYLGAHVSAELGRPTSAAGLVTLAYGLGFGLAAGLDGMIDRIGPARALPPAYAALGGLYALLALASLGFAALVAVALLWGLSNHFGLNVLVLRLSAAAPDQRGTVMGLNSAVTYLCVFAGTLLGGPLYGLGGLALVALLAAGLCLAGAALAWFAARKQALCVR